MKHSACAFGMAKISLFVVLLASCNSSGGGNTADSLGEGTRPGSSHETNALRPVDTLHSVNMPNFSRNADRMDSLPGSSHDTSLHKNKPGKPSNRPVGSKKDSR